MLLLFSPEPLQTDRSWQCTEIPHQPAAKAQSSADAGVLGSAAAELIPPESSKNPNMIAFRKAGVRKCSKARLTVPPNAEKKTT